jgi:ribosomal-protein-alanine N-acetyltransferase
VHEIETARLLLRPLEPADRDAYYERIYADPEVMKSLATGQPISRERFEERIGPFMIDTWREHGFGPWVVIHKEGGELIGHCGLRHWDELAGVEIFYALGRAWWGRGFATEAARAALRFGFEQAGLPRIVAAAKLENPASRRVLEKIGMTLDGIGKILDFDAAIYSLERKTAQLRPRSGEASSEPRDSPPQRGSRRPT